METLSATNFYLLLLAIVVMNSGIYLLFRKKGRFNNPSLRWNMVLTCVILGLATGVTGLLSFQETMPAAIAAAAILYYIVFVRYKP